MPMVTTKSPVSGDVRPDELLAHHARMRPAARVGVTIMRAISLPNAAVMRCQIRLDRCELCRRRLRDFCSAETRGTR